MRVLLATVLILGGVLLLGGCTTEEEPEDDSTATGTVAATAAATTEATATPAGAAASPTPRRDVVRKPTLPTRGPTATPAPIQTVAPQPTVVPVATAAPPPPVQPTTAPPPPVVTQAPVQTPAPLPPSWQTSAPRQPVTAGTIVELGIRNANGAPGETYPIGMLVRLPDQTDVIQEGIVSGDAWLTFYVGDTLLAGTYYVNFGLPQSDLIYAQDYFQVEAPPLSEPSWQVSAPRVAVTAGDTVEVGLRNEYGISGECYDFVVEVYDPDGYYASGEDVVCADEWTYLTYSDTWVSGYYDVSYYIGGVVVATDYFQVGY